MGGRGWTTGKPRWRCRRKRNLVRSPSVSVCGRSRDSPETDAEKIVQQRSNGPYTSLDDLARRTGLSNAVLTRVSRADAFGSLALGRRAALWQALEVREDQSLLQTTEDSEPIPQLPRESPFEEVTVDYTVTGLSLRQHPVAFLREALRQHKVTTAEELKTHPPDRWVKVGGLVLLRQRPSTAKGITFVTLEDETGHVNLIVHGHTWEQYRRIARGATLLLGSGPLQRQHGTIHVLAHHLTDGSHLLRELAVRSRDFR